MKMTKSKIGIAVAAGLVGSGLLAVSLSGLLSTQVPVPPHRQRAELAVVSQKDLHQAWENGVAAGGIGQVMLTPAQCSSVAAALGWHGPLPSSLATTSVWSQYEVVASCEWVTIQSGTQAVRAMRNPLSLQDNQVADTQYLYMDFGPFPSLNGATANAAATACTALGTRCQGIGSNGHWVAYNMVRIVVPEKSYGLFDVLVLKGGG